MRDNFSRCTLEIKNDKQSVQIDMNCKNIEKEQEQKIKEAADEFFGKVEKITGWK